LPQQSSRLARRLAQRPATLDDSLQEGRIRQTLEAVWPLPAQAQPALLHGDFWPGNLLWQGGKLAAVIDWEDAEAGNPLADVASTRLDLLWLFGMEAMQTFTRTYEALTAFDFTTLPYWDLVAALRPAGRLAVWAEGWPALGRSDISEATLRAGHRIFVEQACEKIDAAR
jgi:aminoglycoside phosphotransferase (APT) family kinase protein